MNAYLIGAFAIGADAVRTLSQRAAVRPLSAEDAKQIISDAVDILEKRAVSTQDESCYEAVRQLANMYATIETSDRQTIPNTAADVLQTAMCAIDESHVVGDEQETDSDDVPEEKPPLVEDYGFVPEPEEYALTAGSYSADQEPDDNLFEVLGAFDIASEEQKMNGLKPVTVTIGKSLLTFGQLVIAKAIDAADALNLPGPTARKNCQAHLQWHAEHLAAITGNPDTTTYASGDDLKKWVMQAFIEANAVEEGAAYLEDAWNQMWAQIEEGLKKVPREILKLPGKALEVATGVPWWAWYAGGAAAIGVVGYAAYRVLAGPAGGAVVKHFLRR